MNAIRSGQNVSLAIYFCDLLLFAYLRKNARDMSFINHVNRLTEIHRFTCVVVVNYLICQQRIIITFT